MRRPAAVQVSAAPDDIRGENLHVLRLSCASEYEPLPSLLSHLRVSATKSEPSRSFLR